MATFDGESFTQPALEEGIPQPHLAETVATIGTPVEFRFAMEATTAVPTSPVSWINSTGAAADGRPGSAVGPSRIISSWEV